MFLGSKNVSIPKLNLLCLWITYLNRVTHIFVIKWWSILWWSCAFSFFSIFVHISLKTLFFLKFFMVFFCNILVLVRLRLVFRSLHWNPQCLEKWWNFVRVQLLGVRNFGRIRCIRFVWRSRWLTDLKKVNSFLVSVPVLSPV